MYHIHRHMCVLVRDTMAVLTDGNKKKKQHEQAGREVGKKEREMVINRYDHEFIFITMMMMNARVWCIDKKIYAIRHIHEKVWLPA